MVSMDWKRKMSKPRIHYEQLAKSNSECREERVPKGYVPLLVGSEAELASEKFLVRVSLLKDPCMNALLEMAAQEFGYDQQGILRIPCDTEHFRWIINTISKAT